MAKNFHDVRNPKKFLAHGVKQNIGAFKQHPKKQDDKPKTSGGKKQ